MLYVLVAVIKYCGQINIKRIDFGSLFKVKSIMVGKPRQQDVEAVGHIAYPPIRTESEECGCPAFYIV